MFVGGTARYRAVAFGTDACVMIVVKRCSVCADDCVVIDVKSVVYVIRISNVIVVGVMRDG